MSKVTVDLSEQNPDESVGSNFVLPPVGVYKAKITKCDAESPDDKDDRIHVVIDASPAKGDRFAPIHEYLNLISKAAMWRLDQFLMATKIVTKTKRKAAFDPSTLVGKTVEVYLTHETDTYNGETRTKARVANWILPGTSKAAANGTKAAAEEEDLSEDDDLEALGVAADEEDGAAIDRLTELAEAAGLDVDEYGTWAELAESLGEGSAEEPGEEDASEEEDDLDALAEAADADDEEAQSKLYDLASEKDVDADAYDTWAEVVELIRGGGEDASGSEEEVPDYESMSIVQLKKLAKERSISPTGTREELLARHAEYDESDPFSE